MPVYRTTGVLAAGTALSRITGLVRVAAMAYALGVAGTRLADTYNLANTTPNIVYELFLGGIFTAVFVPVLVDLRTTGRGDPSALISVSLVVLAAVATVTAVAAPLVIRVYTFRIPDASTRTAQLELASFLLRWFAPQIFFYGVCAITQAVLNARNRFGPPAFAPIANNLLVAAMFVGYARVLGEEGLELSPRARLLLGVGTTAGVALQALVLLPFVRNSGLRFRPRFDDPVVRRTLRLSVFVLGYVVVNQIGLWVVLALANKQQGGVTAYQIAFMFFQLPHGLFAVSLHTALFPDLSRAASQADWAEYRRWFAVGTRGVAYLLLPAAVGYAILARPIATVVLARGVADVRDAAIVAGVLVAFAPGLLFFSLYQLLTRCFFALQDTRTPSLTNVVAVAVNVAVAIPLFARFGVRGLAFGHAIAYTTGALLLAWRLHVRVPGGLRLSDLGGALAKIAVGAAVMAAGVWWVSTRALGNAPKVALATGAGAILYLAFSQVARVEEREILLGYLRGRRRGPPTDGSTAGAAAEGGDG